MCLLIPPAVKSVISLDDESVATLVHAFDTSCIDYCNGLLAGASKVVTDRLQRVQ